MGYDLRITRATDWSENIGVEISTEEWMAVVRADMELVTDPANGPYAVRCGPSCWLDWFEGNVFTTDPDHRTVQKMLAIAKTLSAAVQGDGGEFYDSANQWSRRKRGRSQSEET